MAIMQVATSVTIMQDLRFYYNYADGTFYHSYVGGSFFVIRHVTVSVAIVQLEVSAALM